MIRHGQHGDLPPSGLLRAGGLNPELGAFANGFLSRVLALRHGACFLPRPLASWRMLSTGYSSTHSADEEVRRRVVERAAELMATTYADDFPERYASGWLRRATLYQELLDLAARRQERLVELGRGPLGSTRTGALVLRGLRLATRLEYAVTQLRRTRAEGLPLQPLIGERVERRRASRRLRHAAARSVSAAEAP